jgi:hypothetical protein
MHPLTFISQSSRWGTPSSPVSCRRGRGNWASPLATTRTTMWKWEQGQEPDADAQRVLADLLHVPYEQLRAEGWPQWLPIWEVSRHRPPLDAVVHQVTDRYETRGSSGTRPDRRRHR